MIHEYKCRSCFQTFNGEQCPICNRTPSPDSPHEEPSAIEQLGKLLDDAKMQVTFTGWKAELEACEKKLAELQAKLSRAEAEREEHENFCVVRDQSQETVGTCNCKVRNSGSVTKTFREALEKIKLASGHGSVGACRMWATEALSQTKQAEEKVK